MQEQSSAGGLVAGDRDSCCISNASGCTVLQFGTSRDCRQHQRTLGGIKEHYGVSKNSRGHQAAPLPSTPPLNRQCPAQYPLQPEMSAPAPPTWGSPPPLSSHGAPPIDALSSGSRTHPAHALAIVCHTDHNSSLDPHTTAPNPPVWPSPHVSRHLGYGAHDVL